MHLNARSDPKHCSILSAGIKVFAYVCDQTLLSASVSDMLNSLLFYSLGHSQPCFNCFEFEFIHRTKLRKKQLRERISC